MLRILQGAAKGRTNRARRLTLVGQVRGKWVDELRHLCAGLLDAGHPIEIDLAEVSFVDADGLRLFRDLTAAGRVLLVNCALFVAEQLKTLEQDA